MQSFICYTYHMHNNISNWQWQSLAHFCRRAYRYRKKANSLWGKKWFVVDCGGTKILYFRLLLLLLIVLFINFAEANCSHNKVHDDVRFGAHERIVVFSVFLNKAKGGRSVWDVNSNKFPCNVKIWNSGMEIDRSGQKFEYNSKNWTFAQAFWALV